MVQTSQESGSGSPHYCQFKKPEQKQMMVMSVFKGLAQPSLLPFSWWFFVPGMCSHPGILILGISFPLSCVTFPVFQVFYFLGLLPHFGGISYNSFLGYMGISFLKAQMSQNIYSELTFGSQFRLGIELQIGNDFSSDF